MVLVCTNNKLFINLRGLSEAIKTTPTPTHRRPLVYSSVAVTSPAGHTAILDRAHHSNPLLPFTLHHPLHPSLFKRAIKTISIWFPSLVPRFLSATVYCQPKTVTRWNCNSVLSRLLLLLLKVYRLIWIDLVENLLVNLAIVIVIRKFLDLPRFCFAYFLRFDRTDLCDLTILFHNRDGAKVEGSRNSTWNRIMRIFG